MNVTLTSGTIQTSQNIANALLRLVAAETLPMVLQRLQVGNLVQRDFESSLAARGDTVNIPIPPIRCSHSDRTDNRLGNAAVQLNHHIEASCMIPNVSNVLAIPDLLKLYMQPACISIAERIEHDLLSLYDGFAKNQPIGAAGPLTAETIDQIETALFDANVPVVEPKFLVTDIAGYKQLRQLDGFKEYASAHDAGLWSQIDGPVARINELFVFRSPFVHKTVTGSHSLAFAKDAIALVVRRCAKRATAAAMSFYAEIANFGIQISMQYDPYSTGQQFTIELLYGCGILRNQFGVEVRT